MHLNLFGKEVESVFALNGDGEDSITYALGWSLSQSPALLAALGENLFGQPIEFDDARVDLQQSGQDRGFTDIEIFSPSVPHTIIEAKRNWDLPWNKTTEEIFFQNRQRDWMWRIDRIAERSFAGICH